MRSFQPRIRRTRRGDFQLKLPKAEREALRALPSELRDLLERNDPGVGRLFPPAYGDDAERNAEYEELVRADLVSQRLAALDIVESTLDADRLDEEQITAWLGALNDLRLVLGTRLDVTEDLNPDDVAEDDPRAPSLALYYYLGWLEEQVVEALAAGLPDSPED